MDHYPQAILVHQCGISVSNQLHPLSPPVPLYSFDWLVMLQKKELLGGTLLLLAFLRRSVTVDGWLSMDEEMVRGEHQVGKGVGVGFMFYLLFF